jgi:hypothetical protein
MRLLKSQWKSGQAARASDALPGFVDIATN